MTTGLLVSYVRERAGEAAVEETLRRAGVPFTAEELSEPSTWTSYDTRIRLFTAATEVLGDPDAMFPMGAEALRNGMNAAVVLLVRAMGTPRQVYARLPRAVANFSTTSTMQVLEAGATTATIRYQLHEGYVHSRLDCDYARGLISMVPTVFGLAPAQVVHEECESSGYEACVYHLSWDRRQRLPWRRRGATTAADPELAALRIQVRSLQSAATDLVDGVDLDTVLPRIVERAAAAVLAPAYLLAVSAPAGGAPLVHSAGLPDADVPGLTARLLAGEDLGPGAVVVDVRSARRTHGRLAALHRPGEGGLGDERAMLAAYAGHAAAALDLVMALEGSRLETRRAGALLDLAHGLAQAADVPSTCATVARALPSIVGCDNAAVMLWDPAAGALSTAATVGLPADRETVMRTTSLRAEEVPELLGMLSDREPRVLSPTGGSAPMRRLLTSLGVSDAVAVPLLAGSTFLGVVTASWSEGQSGGAVDADVLARLRGVGDQASTALQKARLLETVRHQATHDALTGLPNRVLFRERLATALAAVPDGSAVGVLFCDLDRFKAVNDTLGHAAGDELLRQVSARLRAAVRPGDTVGRLSGDEFAVLLPRLGGPADADSVVARVDEAFAEPFRLDGTPVDVGTSTGVAVRSGPVADVAAVAEQLLRDADAAMYRHKHRDRPPAPSPRQAT
ncbi:diguanylate cyclase domain-containing protein [Geodermatophilus telluris]|uniref:diguanylate cyclase domain-containing protein n=1 Tax=Geodermatophilus telluris TaxID=1190417 RepID=UPI001FDEBE1D|nr:diguanylate cyclase [Geodermatophilus telluris]